MASFKVVIISAILPALTVPLTAASPLPSARPGLWLTEQHVGTQTFKSKFCNDEDSQLAMLRASAGVPPSICGQHNTTVTGNQVAIDSVCAVASSLVISKVVATYTDDSHFTVTSDSTFAPPFMGKSETHTTMDAHWAGSCPFGMGPGDMIGPTGLQARYFPKGARAPA